MNIKLVKGIAAFLCIGSALAMTYKPNSPAADAAKNAVATNTKDLLITNPEKESEYGTGTYRVEGVVPKGADITLFLDRKEVKSFKANPEDGSYLEEVEVKEAGPHTFVVQYLDAKGGKVLKKLDFKVSSAKISEPEDTNKEVVAENTDPKDDGATNFEPGDNTEDVNMPGDTNVPVDSNDPNSPAHRNENGVKDPVKPVAKPNVPVAKKPAAKPTAKPVVGKKPAPVKPAGKKPVAKKPVGKKPVVKKGVPAPFGISSYTNFNVVPHGILQVGGKGKPGDKIVVYVDKKLAMKGTIKPNGRWKFPVKVSNAGFRVITAQNLRTKESKSVKLKIK